MQMAQVKKAFNLLVLACTTITLPAMAGEYWLSVDVVTINTGEFKRQGVGFNGASPGPVLHLKEGENVTIHATNNLSRKTSIHWHGLLVPFDQDGVPGISYPGIEPGETFTYQFPVKQNGTYWFHSHSGFQEPDGAYGAIVIEPAKKEPHQYDRDYVVQLADAHPHRGHRIMRNLKTMPDYYNRQQRTLGTFLKDVSTKGFKATRADRVAWGGMRMKPTDIEDLQGFVPLINGKSATQNWTGIFKAGERVRLRFINSSAMTYFDVRIPGLVMTVVQADGNNVQPVRVDEFRIAVAETYDVIVNPKEDKAYTIFAESMGRTAYARGTLAPRNGLQAVVPELRQPPLLTMADMPHMTDMLHADTPDKEGHKMMGRQAMIHDMPSVMSNDTQMSDGAHSSKEHESGREQEGAGPDHSMHGVAKKPDPYYAPGSGLKPKAANGGKFLSYTDLRAQKPLYQDREATREIELRLTGNMERYVWSVNGIKYEDADPIRLKYGERARFKFINETMMTHPMHLHGMWSILDNHTGKWDPIKHVVSVSPNTTVYMETEVDAPGEWAFHCHLSYHAESGMFRKVIVEGGPESKL